MFAGVMRIRVSDVRRFRGEYGSWEEVWEASEVLGLGLSKSAVRRWWRGDMGELVKVEKFLMLMGLELRVVRGRKLEDRLRDISDE